MCELFVRMDSTDAALELTADIQGSLKPDSLYRMDLLTPAYA